MLWLLGYVIIYALVAGWLYGCDRDERWFFVALFWPFVPFVAIIIAISYVGYKAKQYFDR